jgi:RNA polymerase sigma-70 factor (ECF subfamily)
MRAIALQFTEESAKDHPLSDEQIVTRVLAGEPALFEIIIRRHNRRMYHLVRSILRDEAEVEDAMQEAYFSAYAHLNQFAGSAKFSTWLLKIAINEARRRLRRRDRLTRLDATETALNHESGTPTPEEMATSREIRTLLEAVIDELPDTLRMVFVLREVDGLSTAEVAEALDIAAVTVKVRLHRAKAQLRKKIDKRVAGARRKVFPFPAAKCNRVASAILERIRGAGSEREPPERWPPF